MAFACFTLYLVGTRISDVGAARVITSFRIKNLRAIEDSGVIQLRKINVLVGRNSSGKSTILRLLPLLRQSVEQPTKGPLLWYGRLVDFGDFKNAARDGDTERGVSLEFDLRIYTRRGFSPKYQVANRLASLALRSQLSVKASLVLGRSADDKVGQVRSVHVACDQDEMVIEYGSNDKVKLVSIMGESVQLSSDRAWGVDRGEIIPLMAVLQQEEYEDDEGNIEYSWEESDSPFVDEIVEALASIAHGNTSVEKLTTLAGRLSYNKSSVFFKTLVEASSSIPSLRSRLEILGAESVEVSALRRAVMINSALSIVKAVDEEISQFARSIRYLEPIRATAERYYREQDLAVDEIDSRGTNIAMFLSSLPDTVMKNLQLWTKENFGFAVSVETGTGHVQIKISDGDHVPRNMADLGFGYSQLLPIILQLWRVKFSTPARGAVVAMEQPELHLHPQYQAMLADVIAAISSNRNTFARGRVLIETHSDHFVNRLGSLVSQGKIDPDDIQVIVVSEDGNGSSTAESVGFDKDGVLTANWPVGFFTPDDRR
ncbi:DUF3696 domain-containing protein [Lysobacter sp. Root916]|uniref:AAA family ATPase n=1 Tax=Lysobacter sp. Root916 TaxID=1736606 RepID=UPI0009EC88D1|nr:DUF3696 domain-containing protein [Lysobacter sp. Root916]